MWGISPYSLLKQLPLKDIIKDYLKKKKEKEITKILKGKKKWANSCENYLKSVMIK